MAQTGGTTGAGGATGGTSSAGTSGSAGASGGSGIGGGGAVGSGGSAAGGHAGFAGGAGAGGKTASGTGGTGGAAGPGGRGGVAGGTGGAAGAGGRGGGAGGTVGSGGAGGAACGTLNHSCCAATSGPPTCGPGLACFAGTTPGATCTPCGGLNQHCCLRTAAVPIETCSDGFSCVDRGGDALAECVGGDPGTGVSYVGCTFIGGIDRVVIAKKDVARDLCFNVVLKNPGTATTGLTVPGTFGLEYSQIAGASNCPSRAAASAITASKTAGTISWVDLRASSTYPAHASIDAAMVFVPKSGGISANERLSASNVDVTTVCP